MSMLDDFVQITKRIIAARQALLEATERKINAKEELKDEEAGLIVDGSYAKSGKNKEERDAYLRTATRPQLAAVLRLEASERAAILALELAKDERECLKYLVRIEELGGE